MNSVENFNCIFCKETFDNKEDLQIHFRKHGDPSFNKSNAKKRCTNETEEANPKPDINKELVGCDVCSEVFPTISRAITHKHKVHPDHDAKYFCPWCGKLFTLKHLYNKHLQSNHDELDGEFEKLFHCDTCNIDFNIPTAMLYHNKFFHRQDTDIPELGQSIKLRAYSQISIPIYYCAFCGEEYENKVNLHKHIVDEHSDENQSPQDVMRCPLCQAIFFHLDAYELHLTFHSSDDLYGGKNEITTDLSDYSLDTVPPLMEKVEECQEVQPAETTVEEIDINNLLELAMEESNDQLLKKSKKHKKHKKSKRSAITLDEFLNMNKDVFGEGIDIQGVEEVPTRAITKRLKVLSKPTSVRSPELEKLKKQGIVVKKNPNKNINIAYNLQASNPILSSITTKPNPIRTLPKASPSGLHSSEDVISRLINQKNNQLKIVKKSCQENPEDRPMTQAIDKISENKSNLFENVRMECDSTKAECGLLHESENHDDIENNLISFGEDHQPQVIIQPGNSETNGSIESRVNPIKEPVTSLVAQNNVEVNEEYDFNTQNTCENLDTFENYIQDHKTIDSKDVFENKNLLNRAEEMKMNESNELVTADGTKSVMSNKEREDTTKQIENSSENSLDALKHLSHLTVKTVNNSRENELNINKALNDDIVKTSQAQISECEEHGKNKPMKQVNSNPGNSLEAIKHLISIKMISDSCKIKDPDEEKLNAENKQNNLIEDGEEYPNIHTDLLKKSIQLPQSKPTLNKQPIIGNLKLGQNITIKSLKQSKNENDTDSDSEFNNSDFSNTEDNDFPSDSDADEEQFRKKIVNFTNNQSPKVTAITKNESVENKSPIKIVNKGTEGTNLLKHLKHITAKPINQVTKSTIPKAVNRLPKDTADVNKTMKKTNIKVERNEDNIEVFNIDDSDSDETEHTEKLETKTMDQKSINALKHLTNTITVKPLKSTESSPKVHGGDFVLPGEPPNVLIKKERDKIDPKIEAIKNTLKNLGNNITVKSRNTSPSQLQTRIQNQDSQEQTYDSNEDSHSDTDVQGVKITELDENDHEINDEAKNDNTDNNVLVQTPDGSCRENEFETYDEYDDSADIEAQIKSSTVPKPNEPCDTSISTMNYVKKIGKDVTIKSTENKIGKLDGPGNSSPSPNAKTSATTEFQRPNIVKGTQNVGRKTNQTMKQVTSSNQVNKEVTVQKYQTHTKTVIEEITTTITKTIKTVNKEVRNVQSKTTFLPQKVKGMNTNPTKNLEGVVVKQSVPNQRIRNTPIRPIISKTIRSPNELVPVNTSVRPSTQLVPIRTSVRPPNPRMPNTARLRPPVPNVQSPRFGKPLKVSPGAIINPKRPNSEDGPFSCFKKPKESLIPNPESPNLGANDDGRVEFASSSQTNKNFMSATKSIKGNSVVSCVQMKSETSASSYQLNKLSNMSGLKITKMSQNRQSPEEQSQANASKRTIDAIQKLQMQGLLVKKPRLDSDTRSNEDSENSETGADEDVDYSSPAE